MRNCARSRNVARKPLLRWTARRSAGSTSFRRATPGWTNSTRSAKGPALAPRIRKQYAVSSTNARARRIKWNTPRWISTIWTGPSYSISFFSASELGTHLRRSPRKAAAIPVWLTSERLGSAWEEDTETLQVSRYGALMSCKHPAKAGETLHVIRADTGQKVMARVAWQRPLENNGVPMGIEFVSCDNFWGLDWGAIEEAR